MKQFLIVGVAILSVFLIYYLLTRRVIEKFIDTSAERSSKVLLDESDIPELAAEPSIHDFLLEKDPAFLEEQLGIYDKTRTILQKIILTFANVGQLESDKPKNEQIEDAIQTISKQTFGESPRFCSSSRVKELLNTSKSDGLAPLFKCLPERPDKYLLLLSFASKTIKGQLDSVQGILGLQKISADANDLPPPSEAELSARRTGSANAEGFADSASADAYISAYALPTLPKSNKQTTASNGATANALPENITSQDMTLENELAAWKSAFNSESMTRIKQYLKYCTAALKDIDDINNAGKDGSLIKRINLDKVQAGVKAQLEQRASSSASIPF